MSMLKMGLFSIFTCAILVKLIHLYSLSATAATDPDKSMKFSAVKQYKLDPSWPQNPTVFTGQVYCVGVDDKNGEIYVGQVRMQRF